MSVNFKELGSGLPDLLPRIDLDKHLTPIFGHCYSPKYLANLDFKGLGPKKIRIGRKIFYRREDLLDWLSNRSELLN